MPTAISSSSVPRPSLLPQNTAAENDFAALLARRPPATPQTQANQTKPQIYYVGEFQRPLAAELGNMSFSGIGSRYIQEKTGVPVKEIQFEDATEPAAFGRALTKLTGQLDEIIKKSGGRLDKSFLLVGMAFPQELIAKNLNAYEAFYKKAVEFMKLGGTMVTSSGDSSPNEISRIPGVVSIGASREEPESSATRPYVDNPEIDAYMPGKITLRFVDKGRGIDITGDGKAEFKAAPGADPSEIIVVDGTQVAAREALVEMVGGRKISDIDLADRKLQFAPRQPGQKPAEIIILDGFTGNRVEKNAPGMSHGNVVEGIIRSQLGDSAKIRRIDVQVQQGEARGAAYIRVLGELDRILATPGRLDHIFINKSLDYSGPPEITAPIRARLAGLIARGAKVYQAAGNTVAASASDLKGAVVVGAKEAPVVPHIPESGYYANNPFINARQSGMLDVEFRPDGSVVIPGKTPRVVTPNAGVDTLVPLTNAEVDNLVPLPTPSPGQGGTGGRALILTGTSYAAPRQLVEDLLKWDRSSPKHGQDQTR